MSFDFIFSLSVAGRGQERRELEMAVSSSVGLLQASEAHTFRARRDVEDDLV